MKDDEGLLRSVYTFVPNLRRASGRALSVYLPARAEGFDLRHYDIEVGQLRRRYTEQLDKDDREIMERELARLRQHLEVVKPAAFPAAPRLGDAPAAALERLKPPIATPA